MAPKIDFDVEKIKGFLTRKIGPLPAWAWGAIAAGGLLLFRQTRQQSMSPSRSTSPLLSTSAGKGGLFPTISGNGLPASGFAGGFGGTKPDPRVTFSTPGGFFFEGPIGFDIDRLTPFLTPATPLPGAPTPMPDLTIASPIAPTPTRRSYLPLSSTNIRALFRDFPQFFRGDAEYWVNSFQGTGIPGVTAARQWEWAAHFWPAFRAAGAG